MTQFVEWDGGDVFGISAEHWANEYPTSGKLLFATDDAGALQLVVQWTPGAGMVPITASNLDAVKAAVTSQLNPPPAEPGASDAALLELQQKLQEQWDMNASQQTQLDDVTSMLLTADSSADVAALTQRLDDLTAMILES